MVYEKIYGEHYKKMEMGFHYFSVFEFEEMARYRYANILK